MVKMRGANMLRFIFMIVLTIVQLCSISIGAWADQTYNQQGPKKIIKKNFPSFQQCYEKALKKHPKLYGDIVLGWELAQDGSVVNAEIKSTTMNSPEVQSCMLGVLKKLKFQPPKNELVVLTFPFSFASSESSPSDD
jgi:hypothetical protein